MNNRHSLIIEGASDQLEQILALFEAEKLNNLPTIKLLDIGITATVCGASLVGNRYSIEPIDLYRVWLDSLWRKGFQTAVRSSQSTSTNKKVVRFQNISIEIVIKIVLLADAEIQIFLQVRPFEGKGYLPAGLAVTILDEEQEIIITKIASDRSNLLDLTEAGDLICQLEDSFKLKLTLENESVIESFPN